ncbi:Cytochrome P450 3A9 [Varanus komodoensis]|nr:Cytochrome P450 3A9 [Varanus komodoensis]
MYQWLLIYGVWPYRVFRNMDIPGPTPFPFFGTALAYRHGQVEVDKECFKKYGSTWRFFDGRQPVLAITDPALIKIVLVKECFSTFTNRRRFGPTGKLSKAVSTAEDEQWKRIRTVLSPTFTSGKLKEMIPIIQHHVDRLTKYLGEKAKKGDLLDVKEAFGAYSMDVITSTSFGVTTDSINNPKDPFVKEGRKLVRFSFFSPVFLACMVFPWITPFLNMMNITIFASDAVEFFTRAVKEMKKDREQATDKGRMDFLRMMIESQKAGTNQNSGGTSKGLTDEEITAQAVIFIFAGYEATSNLLGYVAYMLATHPDAQKKLQDEIDTILPKKAQVTQDSLMQMEYLDMVVNETLRMFPVGGRLERVCKQNVELNGITIPKGVVVAIPIAILHYNPAHWSNPEEFRPERFSKEKKEQIDPYIFMPFGVGPRNCIGMRFALLTLKIAIAQLMQNFTFKPCKETQIPLELNSVGLLRPKKPIILKIVSRDESTV